MRKMFSEKQIVGVVNDAIEEGEIQAGGKFYIHFVTISKTNDVEDYPNIGFSFISSDATVDKTKIQNYIKRVAATDSGYKGIQGLGSQDGYAYDRQGP